MLIFPEEILLLLLRDEDGSFLPIDKYVLERALVGSVLIELAFADRIDTDPTQLIVIDCTPTGKPLLDRTLERIAGSKKIRDTKVWIEMLSSEEGAAIRENVLTSLVERGILEQQKKKFMWVFRSSRYPVIDRMAKRDIKKRIMGILFSNEIPGPRDIALICLADVCDILRVIFKESEITQITPRIKQLRKMDLIGREMVEQLAFWKLGYTVS